MGDGALFAYGSLVVEEVMRAVTGLCPVSEHARLPGYLCRRLRGRSSPGIVPSAERDDDGRLVEAEGRLYRGVDEGVFARLDDFEGPLDVRTGVGVATASGAVACFTYGLASACSNELSDGRWSVEDFVRQDLEEFLAECRSFAAERRVIAR